MARRGRNHPASNGPRGPQRGPPGPGLMHPVPGPFLPPMLRPPPHLAPHPGLPQMLMEQKQAEMQRMLTENMPPHLGHHPGLPPIIEQKLATQHAELQRLVSENQHLAASHGALRQELAAMQQEMQHMQANTQHEAEKDDQIRALLDKVSQMEVDLRAMDSLKADLEKLLSQRQELSAQLQFYKQETQKVRGDAHEVLALKSEIDGLHQELHHARMACEQERKASTEHLEQRQAMERNVFSMAREVEKLRAELANAESRAQGAKLQEKGYSVQQTPFVGSWGGAYESQQIIASHDPAPLNGQMARMDTTIGTEAAKYSFESNNRHTLQQVSRDHSAKLNSDSKSVGEWSTHVAPNGKSFYYNSATGATQWEKPAALAMVEAHGLSQLHMPQPKEEKQKVQMLQQSASAQTQSAWLTQSPSGGHTQYAIHPSSQSQVQQQLGQTSYVGLSGETAAGVAAEASVQALHNAHVPPGVNLFAFGIPDDFNDRELAEMFRPYGRVLYAKVGVGRDTEHAKGYGFITMDSLQAAEAAIRAVNGMHVLGKRIKVELQRGEYDAQYQQQSQNVLSGVGPTRSHNRSEMLSRRPY